jgi:hypothetical protein
MKRRRLDDWDEFLRNGWLDGGDRGMLGDHINSSRRSTGDR